MLKMTVEEVFTKISTHMIKGLMVHDEFFQYYTFLGLWGYADCHKWRYLDESNAYQGLNHFYLTRHGKLLPSARVEDPKVIPDAWYKYKRADVDFNTRKNAIKTGITLWEKWERDTKDLYSQMYKELHDMSEIASAVHVMGLILDVEAELAQVESYRLKHEANNYDMAAITEEQNKRSRTYRKEVIKRLKI